MDLTASTVCLLPQMIIQIKGMGELSFKQRQKNTHIRHSAAYLSCNYIGASDYTNHVSAL